MRGADVICDDTLEKEALDLIKRQQAEIERLKAEITRNEVKLLKIEKLHNEQKAIADSRKLDMDYFMNENERLKDSALAVQVRSYMYNIVTTKGVDRILEEMLEDINDT